MALHLVCSEPSYSRYKHYHHVPTETGVPYDVRVFAENGAGKGSSCTITDFAEEGSK